MQNVVTENYKIYLCKRYKFIEIFDIKFSCEMFFFLFPRQDIQGWSSLD
jgi:hypothetical protein